MAVNGKFIAITRDDLLQDAERFGVRKPQGILGDVADAIGAFGQFAREAGLPGKRLGEIEKELRPL